VITGGITDTTTLDYYFEESSFRKEEVAQEGCRQRKVDV